MKSMLTIATRQSALALWQAHFVKDALEAHTPSLKVELLPMTTEGDRFIDKQLNKIGGKGLFVKELEQALLDGRADLAVHSMKDVPTELPPGLCLTAICQRADPRDALVSPSYHWSNLPNGANIGTSSLRRLTQLKHHRPDLRITPLRGNINTRLKKCHEGLFDAIVLAAAGLHRLNLFEKYDAHVFELSHMLPAAGQGALGIECVREDNALREILSALHHEPTAICIMAERRINERLGGNCHTPIAAFGAFEHNTFTLRALLGSPDGTQQLRTCQSGTAQTALSIADQVADNLIQQGAEDILTLCDT